MTHRTKATLTPHDWVDGCQAVLRPVVLVGGSQADAKDATDVPLRAVY